MKKLAVIFILILAVGGGGIFLLKSRVGGGNTKAVLKVTSTPTATVFLDSASLGKTPYEGKVNPGEYTLKLVPDSTDTAATWEGKVTLSANLLTFVNRELGADELVSAGEVLSLERVTGNQAQLAVLSIPDGADVTLSDSAKGTTPLMLADIASGSYNLTVTKSGYVSRSVKIKVTPGYKLNAQFQLALTGEAAPTPTPESSASGSPVPNASAKNLSTPTPKSSPKTASASAVPKNSPPAKPYVEILETPTGFLNVRSEPSTGADVLGRVNPGEFYSLLDESAAGNAVWYKIEYSPDKDGWISSQYAKKYE